QALAALADPARTALVEPAAARSAPAWKTGTSNGRRDAWCVAASPRLVLVAWLGTVRGGGAEGLTGIDAAAPLALALAAALDPQPAGWDGALPAPPLAPPPAPALPPALVITDPAPGALVELDRDRPAAQQRLRLDSRGGSGERRWWYCDGIPLGEGRWCWWEPAPGRHHLAVADETGRAASVTVAVR
ncbi:MAG: hypothetical protein L6R48_14485, partial [Planctomycetes bacterium]|nr:hypothetical protein [Planctomycetota bacterium]